jgi:hypothetical protein
VAGLEPGVAQRFGRRLAFALAEAWVEGLLAEAAGRGEREALMAELWSRRGEPSDAPEDGFELALGAA